jgi:SNF2 family DNA or RNA helicase
MRQKIVARKKTGVVAKMGSGKTRPVVDALVELNRIFPEGVGEYKFPYGPILIVCTGPAIATWTRQLPLWAEDPTLSDWITIGRGSAATREAMWKYYQKGHGIVITNYSIFLRDYHMITQVPWTAIVCDEYHRALLRRGSKTFKYSRPLFRKTDIVVWTSGSALRKNPSSMWTLFNMTDPKLKLFRSYWRFVDAFCIVNDGMFGKEIEGPRNVEGFQKIMDRYLAFVPEEVVADNLPEGKRNPLLAEMTPSQAKVYKDLSEEMIAQVGDSLIVAPNVLAKLMKLRQLLCCPRILSPELDMGGGFEAIWDRIEDDPHCVIFVPFRPAVNIIHKELVRRGRSEVYSIMGGTSEADQTERITRFKEFGGILICTIAYAESFDLETCKTSYFLGYDYVLDVNEQAEGRTRRVISEHEFVTWNYVKYLNTLDEYFLSELGADLRNVKRVLHRPQEFINALKGISNV